MRTPGDGVDPFPIPDGWSRQPLGDVTQIASGLTLGRNLNGRNCRLVPYLRVANVKDGYLDLSEVKKTPATQEEIRVCRLEPGDVLLTEGGDLDKLGRGTFWRGELSECLHQNHIFRVRSDSARFDPAFLAYQFGSPYGKSYFLRHAKQTTGIASINKTVLSNFPLIVPPIAEQRRIARRLTSELDAVASARTAVLTQLDELELLPQKLLAQMFDY
jgi:type I restriction enzyme S subunit